LSTTMRRFAKDWPNSCRPTDVVAFATAEDFLDYIRTDTAALLIPDVRLPALNGLHLIVAGILNNQAAFTLGILEVTLQVHRGQIMRRMESLSFVELVHMCARLRLPDPDHCH
jgi:FixJ family two-component response regulator